MADRRQLTATRMTPGKAISQVNAAVIVALTLAVAPAWIAVSPAQGQDDLAQKATWEIPEVAEIRTQVLEWALEQSDDQVDQLKVETLWPENEGAISGIQLLDRVCATAAIFDESAKTLVELCSAPPTSPILPEVTISEELPAFFQNNLKTLYGRWLGQNEYYDESLLQLEQLTPADVVDPATLLFYQSATYHRRLDKEKCLPRLTQLLQNEAAIPKRYSTVARLMEADLKPLKADSLDEVSRLMDEVRRRLDHYQAGKSVMVQEGEVLAKLDKMIEELEKQQQQQQAGGGGSSSSKPAEESTQMGGHGPGLVDRKFIGNKTGWGNLPPKERQEAMQQIAKDLPAHYREVVEAYFRKLANEDR